MDGFAGQREVTMDPDSSPGFLSILDEGDDDAGEAWPSWPLSNRADAAMYLGANGRWKVAATWLALFLTGESRPDRRNL